MPDGPSIWRRAPFRRAPSVAHTRLSQSAVALPPNGDSSGWLIELLSTGRWPALRVRSGPTLLSKRLQGKGFRRSTGAPTTYRAVSMPSPVWRSSADAEAVVKDHTRGDRDADSTRNWHGVLTDVVEP